jgi:hypothetical protein
LKVDLVTFDLGVECCDFYTQQAGGAALPATSFDERVPD